MAEGMTPGVNVGEVVLAEEEHEAPVPEAVVVAEEPMVRPKQWDL